MASLLGKADSTIGSMSYREAMADVMPDYSDIYKQKAEGFEKNQLAFQKAVGDYFDIQHADNNKLADELKQATTKAMEGLGTDYGSMELFNSHLTSMKDRMKALPKTKKGDFERSKIRAEMNQLLESSNGLSDTLAEVGTMIKAGDFNIHTTDYPILNAINDGTAKKEIVDGNLVYSFVDAKGKKQTIDRRGIKDALGQSDLEIDGNFIKQGPEAFRLGKQGGKFNRNKSVNGYEKMFTSPAGLAANMNEKQGGLEYTFVESLAGKDGSQSIYKALTNMGATTVAKYDANNDNKITGADFASPKNGIALIESLTNPRSDNYNFQAAKTAAAEFYSDNIDQVEFNDGRSLRPAKTGAATNAGGPNQFFLGKQYIPAAAVTPDVNILNEDPKDIPARTAWNQAIFRKVNGQYQVYQDDAFVDVTKEQLRTTLEFSEKVGYDMSGAGGGKTPPKTPEVPADFNKAFRDDEKKVVQYFKNNPSLYPGMKVERTTSDDPEDGNDTFRITMPSGTSKVFTADPFVGDENKIKDTWTWINSNYENNEFAQ